MTERGWNRAPSDERLALAAQILSAESLAALAKPQLRGVDLLLATAAANEGFAAALFHCADRWELDHPNRPAILEGRKFDLADVAEASRLISERRGSGDAFERRAAAILAERVAP